HLAFDQQGEIGGAHVALGLVEIEEDAAFGVERTFGRVEVFGNVAALLVFRVERARGEGDDLAGLVGDGEGNALAEARVHRTGRAVGLLLALKRPLARSASSVKCWRKASRMALKSSGA